MITVHRAGERAVTEGHGFTSWHCFSSGAHYDPGNVSFGPVTACDEHLVEPGGGFDSHRHTGVELVSWVLDGALAHSDDHGRTHRVEPGTVQYQRTGRGIVHAERNASDDAPLRFVQLWLLCADDTTDYSLTAPPLDLRAGRLTVVAAAHSAPRGPAFAFVARGAFEVAGWQLAVGDSLRTDEPMTVDGAGELLVVEF